MTISKLSDEYYLSKYESFIKFYDRVPHIEREIYKYCIDFKMGQSDIAALTGLTQGAISHRISRMFSRLDFLEEVGSDKREDFCKEIDNISLAFWNDAAMIEVLPKAPLTVREDDSDAYERLMPNNWGIMTFSDRVDFMLKVQHEGSLKYILDKDAKLKKYYEGLRKKTDPKLKIYITLFSFDSKSYSKQSKDLIRNFVAILNNLGRAMLQYVECTNPDMVEIREVR